VTSRKLYPLRGLGPWIWFVSSVGTPLYRLLWEYAINFRGKRLYSLSHYREVRDDDLDRRGFTFLYDPELMVLARLVREGITSEIIERERQSLLATTGELSYTTDLFPSLSNDARAAILRIALHPHVLKYVMSYLKVAPRMRPAGVLFNIVRSELGEEGSKLWHRDAYSYRCLTLLMCLSEVDDSSGPFFIIGKDQIPFHAEVPKTCIDPLQSPWKRYRLSDEEIFPYVDQSEIRKLTGEIGTAILWDSGACYHKGGCCKAKERLLLEIRYVTDDGDADLPGWANVVDLARQDVAPLVANPLCRHMLAPGDTSLIRRLQFFRVLKTIYFRALRYHARPKMKMSVARELRGD